MKNQKFYNIEQDGITQGLLGKWMECRQMARWYLQGWSPKGSSMALTYGTIVHAILERCYKRTAGKRPPSKQDVMNASKVIEKMWKKENTLADKKSLEYLELSLLIAEATMPVYFEYWHKDFKFRWEMLEQEFKIPYLLEDGRKTFVRGKLDGAYGHNVLRLFETKTKSQINENDLVDMLPFELQINEYLWALRKLGKNVNGSLYNIIRRIGLEQRKKESITQFSKRCVEDIRERPEHYFLRLEILITKQDMERFEAEFEDMIKDFYDWWQGKAGHYKNTGACISKYGRCKYLTACATNKMGGYIKRDQVFRELEDVK